MSLLSLLPVTLLLLRLATALTPGPTPENNPKLTTYKCTLAGGCVPQTSILVLDQLSHPVYQLSSPSQNCGSWGSAPNVTACPDEETCAKNCIVDGIADYSAYGITTNGSSLVMNQLNTAGNVVSPRAYLLNTVGDKYEMLKLSGNELSFDVDSSRLPCGMNGALYLSEMEEEGGKSAISPTGASYGGGYCDAQCFTLPFINGVANINASGACCNEMDIWEANALATSLAPHTCNHTSLYAASASESAFNGVCDKNGCSYNPYLQGNKDFYGRGAGFEVDTNRPFTVVTQFPEVNGTMTEIRRLYIQDGKIIKNAAVNTTGTTTPSIDFLNDPDFCSKPGVATRYMDLGGTTGMGNALARGMVLIFSVWWDEGGFMNWLDSGNAGPCNATEGDPKVVLGVEKSPAVTWSNVKWGEIGSTFSGKASA